MLLEYNFSYVSLANHLFFLLSLLPMHWYHRRPRRPFSLLTLSYLDHQLFFLVPLLSVGWCYRLFSPCPFSRQCLLDHYLPGLQSLKLFVLGLQFSQHPNFFSSAVLAFSFYSAVPWCSLCRCQRLSCPPRVLQLFFFCSLLSFCAGVNGSLCGPFSSQCLSSGFNQILLLQSVCLSISLSSHLKNKQTNK